ncbi:MAG TPA: hypothetical protein VMG08_01300 [Allosphingosinicella sp.]|nr:hypothetical protein [Allosphingosinicella sp.]
MHGTGHSPETLRRELLPGERIVWSGGADSAAALRDQLWPITFSLLWNGGAFAMLGLAEVHSTSWGLFTIAATLAVGFYMLGASILEWRAQATNVYAITDRRLIVAPREGRRPAKWFRLAALKGAERMSASPLRATFRIPLGLVPDGDGGQEFEYLKLYGVTEPDRVGRLLATGVLAA